MRWISLDELRREEVAHSSYEGSQTVISARRILCTVFLLSTFLCSFAVSAYADCTVNDALCATDAVCHTYGDRFRNQGGSDNGTRAYIAGSGHNNSAGIIRAFVAIDANTGTASPGTSEDYAGGLAGVVMIGKK